DVEAAAAVLHGRPRVKPSLGAELEPERAQLAVAPIAILLRGGLARDVRGHVGLEPRTHLAAEPLLLIGIGDLEVHGVSGARGARCRGLCARRRAPFTRSMRDRRELTWLIVRTQPGRRQVSRTRTTGQVRGSGQHLSTTVHGTAARLAAASS